MRISTAAIIRVADRLLFIRRPVGGALSECWELPGGKVDPGEDAATALARELMEELRLKARVGALQAEAAFEHDGKPFRLLGFAVEPADPLVDLLQEIVLVEHEEAALLTPREAARRRLAPSDRSLLEEMGEL